MGRNLFFTSEGNLCGGLSLSFFMIAPTRKCGNGCTHIKPHPGLKNLEFGRVFTTSFYRTLSAVDKKPGCEPQVKNAYTLTYTRPKTLT